jgi:hypothetical protein
MTDCIYFKKGGLKMAHEETIYGIMEALRICDKHTGGDIMAARGIWTKGTSSVNNFYKGSNTLVDAGKLVKGDGYFKMPDCKSEYKEHSQLLTKALAEILKLNYQSQVLREPTLTDVGLRPDAILFLANGNKGLCFILEVCNNESPEYLNQKINAWRSFEGAKDYLSQLFETEIKAFDIVVSGDISTEGTFEFNQYLKEVAG